MLRNKGRPIAVLVAAVLIASTAAAAGGTPTLTVDSSDERVVAGETVTVDVEITNDGDGPAYGMSASLTDVPDSWTLVNQHAEPDAVWSDKEQSWVWTRTELKADETFTASLTFEVPADARAGEYDISITAADDRSAEETATSTVTVKEPGADIQVQKTALQSDQLSEGETTTVEAVVENTGAEAGNETITLNADGDTRSSTAVHLDPGERRNITLDATFDDAGTYDLTMDEAAAGTVTVEPASGEFSMTGYGELVEAGEEATVEFTVENTGDGELYGVGVTLSDIPDDWEIVDETTSPDATWSSYETAWVWTRTSLQPGEQFTVTATFEIPDDAADDDYQINARAIDDRDRTAVTSARVAVADEDTDKINQIIANTGDSGVSADELSSAAGCFQKDEELVVQDLRMDVDAETLSELAAAFQRDTNT